MPLAYHSTRQKGLKQFDSHTTKAKVHTGEGISYHGWGLYLQSDEMANRLKYYYGELAGDVRYRNNDKIITIGDDDFYLTWEFGDYYKFWDDELPEGFYDIKKMNNIITFIINGYSIEEFKNRCIEDYGELPNYYREMLDKLEQLGYIIKDVEPEDDYEFEDGTHSEDASQYAIEIPDDMIFIDEDVHVPNELIKEFVAEYNTENTESEMNGKAFYNNLTNALGDEEQASLWLSEHGIDGMTYYGREDGVRCEDGLCYVIFNCDKLKIIGEY